MIKVDEQHPQFQPLAHDLLSLHNWRMWLVVKELQPNATFREFVTKLHTLHEDLPGGLSYHNFINVHFAPQWQLCGADVGLSYNHVLRVEEINEWYDDLVRLLRLSPLTRGGWPGDEQCFFSTKKHPCQGPWADVDERGGVVFNHP